MKGSVSRTRASTLPVSEIPAAARVFIVDSHAVVRNGLCALLQRNSEWVVCGEASTREEALGSVTEARPDVALMELALGDAHGLDLLGSLKESLPALPVLVLSIYDETYYAERCLRAGAKGYIMKREPIEEVEKALRTVLEGKVYLSRVMSEEILLAVARGDPKRVASPVNLLTNRELEVFESIGQGLGASEIARKLRLSVKTIESYQAKLKEKLNLKDSSQLFQHALHWVEHR